MADIKPIFWLFIYIALTDVIVKITVADLIATFMADVIVIMCEIEITHVSCYYLIIIKVADDIAIIFCVIDGKTTEYPSVCWLMLLPW